MAGQAPTAFPNGESFDSAQILTLIAEANIAVGSTALYNFPVRGAPDGTTVGRLFTQLGFVVRDLGPEPSIEGSWLWIFMDTSSTLREAGQEQLADVIDLVIGACKKFWQQAGTWDRVWSEFQAAKPASN